MKKIIAILLSMMLLLGCGAAMAEETGKTTIGTISINGAFTLQCGLPEGYQVKPILLNQDHVIAVLVSEDETKPVMTLSVAYDETYADVHRMNELDDEARQLLEKTFTDVDPTIEISYGETGLGTELLIAKQTYESYNYIDFMSIYEGYFIEFVMTAPEGAEDKTLSDDQLRMCIDFLTDLDFVPAGENADGSVHAGKVYTARLTAYQPDTGMTEWTLREPIIYSAEEVENLIAGDILPYGPDDGVTVETIETDEYGDMIINGDIEMRKAEDGSYLAYQNEIQYMLNGDTVNVALTEDLVFLDGIEMETGYMLDEPTQYTGVELNERMMRENEVGFGFDADNVRLTFDENGQVVVIERFYVPWQ